jgi:hypothetical protein
MYHGLRDFSWILSIHILKPLATRILKTHLLVSESTYTIIVWYRENEFRSTVLTHVARTTHLKLYFLPFLLKNKSKIYASAFWVLMFFLFFQSTTNVRVAAINWISGLVLWCNHKDTMDFSYWLDMFCNV